MTYIVKWAQIDMMLIWCKGHQRLLRAVNDIVS